MANQKLEKDGITIEFNLEEFQEARPEFTPLDAKETIELLKEAPKTKKARVKLEKGIEYLVEKQTWELYKIVMGKIPTEKERLKRDITASMMTIESGTGEQRLIMLGYTKDGGYSPANQFEIYKEEQGESNDQGTSTTTN